LVSFCQSVKTWQVPEKYYGQWEGSEPFRMLLYGSWGNKAPVFAILTSFSNGLKALSQTILSHKIEKTIGLVVIFEALFVVF